MQFSSICYDIYDTIMQFSSIRYDLYDTITQFSSIRYDLYDTIMQFNTAYLMSFTDATLPVFFRYIFHWGFNTLQMEHCWTGLAAQ
jgi:hypothetical protein